jgi:hypothetical protein
MKSIAIAAITNPKLVVAIIVYSLTTLVTLL